MIMETRVKKLVEHAADAPDWSKLAQQKVIHQPIYLFIHTDGLYSPGT